MTYIIQIIYNEGDKFGIPIFHRLPINCDWMVVGWVTGRGFTFRRTRAQPTLQFLYSYPTRPVTATGRVRFPNG